MIPRLRLWSLLGDGRCPANLRQYRRGHLSQHLPKPSSAEPAKQPSVRRLTFRTDQDLVGEGCSSVVFVEVVDRVRKDPRHAERLHRDRVPSLARLASGSARLVVDSEPADFTGDAGFGGWELDRCPGLDPGTAESDPVGRFVGPDGVEQADRGSRAQPNGADAELHVESLIAGVGP